MKSGLIAASILGAAVATSVPHTLLKRQADKTSGLTDADILNFALTLEHLEAAFYKAGNANFSSSFNSASQLGSSLAANIAQIGSDESNHVALLTAGLTAAGATPVQACTYNFGVKDAQGFLAVAQVLEGVGVSAYIGAAKYITSPDYLQIAAEILTVEARHNAYIRLANDYSSFPSPYDTGLSPKAIISLAGSFFVSCPDGSAPTIQPFPAAAVNATGVKMGSTIQVAVNSSLIQSGSTYYCSFASGVTPAFSTFQNGSCEVPSANVTGGQIYGFITTAQNISDASTVAGPFILDLDMANNTVSAQASGSAKTQAAQNSGAVALSAASVLGFVGLAAALLA